jgi:glucosamine--fructose-6-phosphate aminotransferase (isomerizing)
MIKVKELKDDALVSIVVNKTYYFMVKNLAYSLTQQLLDENKDPQHIKDSFEKTYDQLNETQRNLQTIGLMIAEIETVPAKIEVALKSNDMIKELAKEYKDAKNFLYLGRGYGFPVALEGALKLKEISYIHAEGYPADEMKHGPIALIDEEMPVFVIATKGTSYEKVVSNIQEVKARKGKIIAIVTAGDVQVRDLADHVIEIPETDENLVPLLATVPLQLLSYHISVMRGCNVDQPRNLAKSVTVE